MTMTYTSKGARLLQRVAAKCAARGNLVVEESPAKYMVSYRRVGARRDTLIGGIVECHEGPFATYDEAHAFAVRSNSKPFTPYFFFVEQAE